MLVDVRWRSRAPMVDCATAPMSEVAASFSRDESMNEWSATGAIVSPAGDLLRAEASWYRSIDSVEHAQRSFRSRQKKNRIKKRWRPWTTDKPVECRTGAQIRSGWCSGQLFGYRSTVQVDAQPHHVSISDLWSLPWAPPPPNGDPSKLGSDRNVTLIGRVAIQAGRHADVRHIDLRNEAHFNIYDNERSSWLPKRSCDLRQW